MAIDPTDGAPSATPSPARTRRALAALLACALASLAFGCAFGEFRPHDPYGREYALEKDQKTYSDYVRWSKFDEAAAFVLSDERDAFMRTMPDFDEVRFTDYETAPWEFSDEEMRSATIRVEYKGYSLRSMIEVEVSEVQTWSREGRGNDWRVSSTFEGLDQFAAK